MAQITLRDYLQEAEDAIRDDRIEDAFTYCRNILTQFPESLDTQRLLGEAYLAQGQLEEAQQSFDWILTNDPENVVAYCNRALICERSLDYDTALDCYQQAYELSHGNSQIRQEFNRLSTETGPQGFMFSRAGLARLYMRGDLLTQAIQEWETVLAVSPERLDARTGLLETCWREAYYDRVEQLATQILQDVPGCLKALFLLAYVISAKNVQQAQELLKRAEALDPDLLMAQELFSDMMARQPAEPFLQLLKKAPVTVETSEPQFAATVVPGQEAAFGQPTSFPSVAIPSEALAAWNNIGMGAIEDWSNDATLIENMHEKQQIPELASTPPWAAEANSSLDVWSVLEGLQGSGTLQELQNVSSQLQGSVSDRNPLNYDQSLEPLNASSQQEGQSLETWLPEPSFNMMVENNEEETELPLWDSSGLYESLSESGSTGDSGIWGNTSKEGSLPSPPAWLNMLTQSEIRQLNDEEEKPGLLPVEEEPIASPPPAQPMRKQELEETSKPAIEEEEAFSFGPEWLKSLGAASIETETSPAEPSRSEARQPVQVSSIHELQPTSYEIPVDEPLLQPFSEKSANPVGTIEYDVLATLEGLDAGLRSQGFVPLEPNTLQAIAKTQEAGSSTVPQTPELPLLQEKAYEHESASSAFAELGNFVQDPINSPSIVNSSNASAQRGSSASFEEPTWLTSLNTVPTASPVAERQQEMLARQEEQIYSTLPPVQSSWAGAYTPYEAAQPSSTQEEALLPPEVHSARPTRPLHSTASSFQEKELVRKEEKTDNSQSDVTQPVWSPIPSDSLEMRASARQPSNNDFLLNGELETTMKRPAVRLQPMSYSFAQNDHVPLSPRSGIAEPTYAGRGIESSVSYQERLLKGYQHQLVGDYDEAMQEYRIIIRNSPELLGEVVSNVRALLKLAPKYSTGYRVLGDAYMRQGEYLQAMESYNKALTMAKKAKN